jgi:hypothetical protein
MRVKNSCGGIWAVAMCAVVLSACVAVPPLQPIAGAEPDPNNTNPKSISINDVVVRVKCELRDSIASRTGPDYDWMDKWTAQADLNLAVNDQSAIAPGAVFTQPLTAASIPLRVTNMPRSASLGIGASASTTAARTEIVSFSISLKEIRDEFNNKTPSELHEECYPHSMVGLTGDLGLKEWVDSALGPVQNHLLKPGHHSPPKAPGGGGAGAVGAPGAKPQALSFVPYDTLLELAKILKDNDTLKQQISLIYNEYQLLIPLSAILEIAQSGMSKPGAWDSDAFDKGLRNFANVPGLLPLTGDARDRFAKLADAATIQKVFDKLPATPSKTQLGALVTAVQNKLAQIERAMANDIPPAITQLQLICDCTPPDPEKNLPDTLKKYSNALKCLNTLLSIVKANIPPKPAPLDPPIDAISHQVQFIVALSASANPAWSLVHFKGPIPLSGNFASLNGTSTDTLTLTIGVPGSQATVNSRGALTLSTALANQLIPAQQANPTAPIIP